MEKNEKLNANEPESDAIRGSDAGGTGDGRTAGRTDTWDRSEEGRVGGGPGGRTDGTVSEIFRI